MMTQIVRLSKVQICPQPRWRNAMRKRKRRERITARKSVVPCFRFESLSVRILFFHCGKWRDFDSGLLADRDGLQVRSRSRSRADALTGIVIQHRSLSKLCSHPFSQPAFSIGLRLTAIISVRVKTAVVTTFARIHRRKLIRHVTRLNTWPNGLISDNRTRGLLRRRSFGRAIGIVCWLGPREGGAHCQADESQKSGHRVASHQWSQFTNQSLCLSAKSIAEVIQSLPSRTDCPARISGQGSCTGRIRPPADSDMLASRSGVVCGDSGRSCDVREADS